MNWLPVIGLVLNVLGSVLFIVDTNKLSSLLTSMVKRIAEDHGRFDSRSFSEQEIGLLQNRIIGSRRLTLLGYLFFIMGFLMQLVSLLN